MKKITKKIVEQEAQRIQNQEVLANVSVLIERMLKEPNLVEEPEFEAFYGDSDNEILQYYLVSDWLLGKLQEKHEIVNPDFYGLPIWGRCTAGQAISQDSVIQKIAQENLQRS